MSELKRRSPEEMEIYFLSHISELTYEMKAFKENAVEVLAKELEIKKTYEAYFGYVFPEAVIRFKKDKPDFDKETRAEARELLRIKE